ncbi:MAG: hypothetical protein KDB82_02690 [Planctomycetes bacterium]|nr:hypothetical protein [Planctomycetota bacterium]
MTKRFESLDAAVDLLAEAQFYGTKLAAADRDAAAAYIARRQGAAGAYAGSFALTPEERAAGVRVFSGERMTSASARHIIGEESCRILRSLKGAKPGVKKAQQAAEKSMRESFIRIIDGEGHPGVFCCGKCTAALWRNVASGAFGDREKRFADGMKYLKKMRKGGGEWQRFPFHYTLLALTEIGEPARAELKYAAPVCERKLKRKPGADKYAQRRHDVMTRALEIANGS